MRGVVFTGNSTLEVMNFDDPKPGPGQAVVRMKASGIPRRMPAPSPESGSHPAPPR